MGCSQLKGSLNKKYINILASTSKNKDKAVCFLKVLNSILIEHKLKLAHISSYETSSLRGYMKSKKTQNKTLFSNRSSLSNLWRTSNLS